MKTLTTTCIALAIVMGLSLTANAQNRGKYQRRGVQNETRFIGGIVDRIGKNNKNKKYVYDLELTLTKLTGLTTGVGDSRYFLEYNVFAGTGKTVKKAQAEVWADKRETVSIGKAHRFENFNPNQKLNLSMKSWVNTFAHAVPSRNGIKVNPAGDKIEMNNSYFVARFDYKLIKKEVDD